MQIYTITVVLDGGSRLNLSFKSFFDAKDMLDALIERALDSDNRHLKFIFEEEIDE